ncbi:hypothetical protein EUREKA_70 [Mycobacterium phage Eureka]|uniref:Uncharacterized protein n=2 Tax=Kostyavirus eureka TaxID=1074306 RepID=G1JWU0_9CAUD|nr:hypothetical protein GOKU_70 [Mycobacterium phage Goku]YP_009591610.1 hypothetical protein FDG60_gp070 [Mycobacterium phage Eureka]AEL98085.1 hypothetical protein EUREKA_70 [Mycobacterium phage Eureka]AGT14178.1 hypothetical protein GOKU_70 [Mycobacterium phage Goku]
MMDEEEFHHEPLTPVGIEKQMARALHYVKKGTRVVKETRSEYLARKRAYKLALAEARQSDTGTRADREDRALISTKKLWEEMDEAEVAMKYAEDKRDDLEKELSALQTGTKLVSQEYNVSTRR